jgi:hypothetical protein
MPFARTEDPNVTALDSVHVFKSSMSVFGLFGMRLKWGASPAASTISEGGVALAYKDPLRAE